MLAVEITSAGLKIGLKGNPPFLNVCRCSSRSPLRLANHYCAGKIYTERQVRREFLDDGYGWSLQSLFLQNSSTGVYPQRTVSCTYSVQKSSTVNHGVLH